MSSEIPHVVFICLDSVRKDVFDTHAPRIQKRSSVSFEQMRSMASWTVPSHAAMLTGNLAHETGCHAYDSDLGKIRTKDTWISSLKDENYTTHGYSANAFASPSFGFDKHFDYFTPFSYSRYFPDGMEVHSFIHDRKAQQKNYLDFVQQCLSTEHPVKSIANGAILKMVDISANIPFTSLFDDGSKKILDQMEKQLSNAGEPSFIFANLMEAHGPHRPFRGMEESLYDASKTFTSNDYDDWTINTAEQLDEFEDEIVTTRELYRAEVNYLDKVVSQFIDSVRDSTERDVAFVITADHGENLGYAEEDYLIQHTSSLSEGLLHVPFVICDDRIESQTVSELTSHRDIDRLISGLIKGAFNPDSLTRELAFAEITGSCNGLPDENERYWDRGQRVAYLTSQSKHVKSQDGSQRTYRTGEDSCWQEQTDEEFETQRFDRFGDWVQKPTEDKDTVTDDVKSRLEDLGYS